MRSPESNNEPVEEAQNRFQQLTAKITALPRRITLLREKFTEKKPEQRHNRLYSSEKLVTDQNGDPVRIALLHGLYQLHISTDTTGKNDQAISTAIATWTKHSNWLCFMEVKNEEGQGSSRKIQLEVTRSGMKAWQTSRRQVTSDEITTLNNSHESIVVESKTLSDSECRDFTELVLQQIDSALILLEEQTPNPQSQ